MSDDDAPDPRFSSDDWWEAYASIAADGEIFHIPHDEAWWEEWERELRDVELWD